VYEVVSRAANSINSAQPYIFIEKIAAHLMGVDLKAV
jgi:hypothetical protein